MCSRLAGPKRLPVRRDGELQVGPDVAALGVPAHVHAALRVQAHRAAAMGTGIDLPVIGAHQRRVAEGAPAVARDRQHHVADITREDAPPGERHRVARAGGRVHAAAHAGVVADLPDALDPRALLGHARDPGGGILAALVAVDPRDQHGAVGRHREPVERVRDGPVLVHPQGRPEGPAAVEGAGELQVGREERPLRLGLARGPGHVDRAARGHRQPRRMMERLDGERLGIDPHRRRAVADLEHVELVGVAFLGRPRHERPAVRARRHRRAGEVELVPPAHVLVLEARPERQLRGRRGGGGRQDERDRHPDPSHAHRHLQETPP